MEKKSKTKVEVLSKYFIYFMCYALIGWIYETVLEVWIYKTGFTNRGFLFGPYLPVYGFGALIFILCLRNIKKKKNGAWKFISPILVFLGIVIIATTLELITSYIMEFFNGNWLWNYDHYPFNFEGRIALNPSMRFGIGGMVFMYIVQPLLEKITNAMSKRTMFVITIVLGVIVLIDLAVKVI